MQPYNSSYNGSGSSSPRVRVGGQLYSLFLDREGITLQQVSQPEISPYVYPYNVITGVFPVSNEYYEPCIEVNISFDGAETSSMIMVFESEEEKNSVLLQIQSSQGLSSAGMPPVPPVFERNPSVEPDLRQNQTYDSYGSHESYGSGYSEQEYSEHGRDEYNRSGYGAGDYNSHVYDSEKYGNYDDYSDYEPASSVYDSKRSYDSYGSENTRTFDEYRYSQGDLSLIEKIMGFIRYPGETFESAASDNLKSGVIYAALMLVMFSVVSVFLSAFIAALAAPESTIYGTLLSNIPELIRLILEYLIFGFICIIVYGLLVFLFTKITGQGLELSESLLTTFYSTTAIGTIGMIPFFGILIAPLWMIFLQIKGLCSGYDADVKFAAVSAIVPAIVMFALFYYIVISGEVAFI